jgi:hypothetical protein
MTSHVSKKRVASWLNNLLRTSMAKLTIRDLYSQQEVKGEIGIEIEAEGVRLPKFRLAWDLQGKAIQPNKYWTSKHDPSLRGEDSVEYVYHHPFDRADVLPSLLSLRDELAKNKGKIIPCDRAGVHVHKNVQHLTYDQCLTFICLYLVFEPILLHYCGDARNGNMFCLGAEHSEYLIERLVDSRRYNTFKKSVTAYTMRYASINLEALSKFGSVEFRAMRTDAEFVEPVNTWVNVLLKIYDKSLTFAKVENIVEQFSNYGCEGFATYILEELTDVFWYEGAEREVFDAMRRVQDVAYAPQIAVFKPIDPMLKWALRDANGNLVRPEIDMFRDNIGSLDYDEYYSALRMWEQAGAVPRGNPYARDDDAIIERPAAEQAAPRRARRPEADF